MLCILSSKRSQKKDLLALLSILNSFIKKRITEKRGREVLTHLFVEIILLAIGYIHEYVIYLSNGYTYDTVYIQFIIHIFIYNLQSCFFFAPNIFPTKKENNLPFQSFSMRFRINLFVEMLCSGPNASATAVHARHMTLYGILKSGVGRLINKDSVRNCTK